MVQRGLRAERVLRQSRSALEMDPADVDFRAAGTVARR
jgi:hypothetical protein